MRRAKEEPQPPVLGVAWSDLADSAAKAQEVADRVPVDLRGAFDELDVKAAFGGAVPALRAPARPIDEARGKIDADFDMSSDALSYVGDRNLQNWRCDIGLAYEGALLVELAPAALERRLQLGP